VLPYGQFDKHGEIDKDIGPLLVSRLTKCPEESFEDGDVSYPLLESVYALQVM
jgi:hypothetical protein